MVSLDGLYGRGVKTYSYLIDSGGKAFLVRTRTFPGDDYGSQQEIVDAAIGSLRFDGD